MLRTFYEVGKYIFANDGLSLSRAAFIHKAVHVVSVRDEVELGQIFLKVLWYSSAYRYSINAPDSSVIALR
jgi:hypothetical protein